MLFKDPYDDITIEQEQFKVSGTLHETDLKEPLTLVDAAFT